MRYYFTTWANGMISVRKDVDGDERAAVDSFCGPLSPIDNIDAEEDLDFDGEDMSAHDFGLEMRRRGWTPVLPGVFGWTLWSKS